MFARVPDQHPGRRAVCQIFLELDQVTEHNLFVSKTNCVHFGCVNVGTSVYLYLDTMNPCKRHNLARGRRGAVADRKDAAFFLSSIVQELKLSNRRALPISPRVCRFGVLSSRCLLSACDAFLSGSFPATCFANRHVVAYFLFFLFLRFISTASCST